MPYHQEQKELIDAGFVQRCKKKLMFSLEAKNY